MSVEAWLRALQAGQTASPLWNRALERYGDIAAVVAAAPADLVATGLSEQTVERLRHPNADLLSGWQDWLARPGHRLLTLDNPAYPQLLRRSAAAPLALWARGHHPDKLDTPQLAMVGSRNATSGGMANAHAFAEALGNHGLTITSGLATGIDTASHRGALNTMGGTVAVLGNGIDLIYPHNNGPLAEEIAAKGIIVSEYPPGTPPQRHQFPARNRIIAGLSLGVLVIEAGRQSGSLITARIAGEQGREVFAVPGSIHNPMARGCHQLLRQGAKLVEDANDVLSELAPLLQLQLDPKKAAEPASLPAPTLAAEYSQLLEAVGFDPTSINTIVARSTLTTAEVSSMLLLLELEGHVEALPGGRYTRRA